MSYPLLKNNLFWQNRYFNITVGDFGGTLQNQQHLVTLRPVLNQTTTGQCPTSGANGGSGPQYWDIGVRGDTGPTNHNSGFTLTALNSVLTDLSGGYSGNGNIAPSNPGVVRQYCNGSRVPPENGGFGFQVPPGVSDATLPSPVFNLTPAATVDEGNNWINLSFGPLTLTDLSGATLGNYSLMAASAAIDKGDDSVAPDHDFFGNPRPQGSEPDIGAVEFVKTAAADADIEPSSLAFGTVAINTTSASQFVTLSSTGSAPLTGISATFTGPFARATGGGLSQNCGTTLAVGSTCRIYVTFHPTAGGPATGTMTVNSNDASPDAATDRVVTLTGTGTRLSRSPATLAFLTVGSGFSAVQNVTVSNLGAAGSGSTGPITATVTGVTNGTIFQIANNNCPAAGLLPGQTCRIGVQFRSPSPFCPGERHSEHQRLGASFGDGWLDGASDCSEVF